MTLADLAKKHGTDKFFHQYCDHYERVLSQVQDKQIRLLEVGICHGNSLTMWKEFFPLAEIHGVDIKMFHALDHTSGMYFHQVDCDDIASLMSLSTSVGEFDVIIDDGGHTMRQQQNVMKTLWKNLKLGGIFIMEDLHTSLPKYYPGLGGAHDPTTLNLCQALEKQDGVFNSRFLPRTDFDVIKSETSHAQVIWSRPEGQPGHPAPSITSIIIKRGVE